VRNAIEPSSLFVIRANKIPWRMFRIGGRKHGVTSTRVFVPASKRLQVHLAELPVPKGIVNASLKSTLLLFLPTSIQYLMRIVHRLRYISRQSDTAAKPPVLLGRAKTMTYSTPACCTSFCQRLRSPHLPENVACSAEGTSGFFHDQTGSAELRLGKYAGSHVR